MEEILHNGSCRLYLGDCMELMDRIPDGSVDMVLCDLPYGVTDNKWDVPLPLSDLWRQYRRVCKERAFTLQSDGARKQRHIPDLRRGSLTGQRSRLHRGASKTPQPAGTPPSPVETPLPHPHLTAFAPLPRALASLPRAFASSSRRFRILAPRSRILAPPLSHPCLALSHPHSAAGNR